jgi:hypothetical protein
MLPPTLAEELFRAAKLVIAKVLAHGGARSAKPSDEVSAVRTMTLDGFDEIAVAWSSIIRTYGYSIDLRAVFCHSRPQVRFAPVPHPNYSAGATLRRCELADLLIVMDHVDRVKKTNDRRAVLVQAKILKSGAVNLSGREWVQHELLAWLPAFTFVDSNYDPRSRKLNQAPLVGSPLLTAEYGGIDLTSSPPKWRHELTQTTAPWFNAPISLAHYLASMATGGRLCSREAVRGGSDDWSFTVDELLRITAAHSITKAGGIARGNNNVIGLIADTSAFITNSVSAGGSGRGSDNPDEDMSEWPEGPISTIHMTLGSIDDRPEE